MPLKYAFTFFLPVSLFCILSGETHSARTPKKKPSQSDVATRRLAKFRGRFASLVSSNVWFGRENLMRGFRLYCLSFVLWTQKKTFEWNVEKMWSETENKGTGREFFRCWCRCSVSLYKINTILKCMYLSPLLLKFVVLHTELICKGHISFFCAQII